VRRQADYYRVTVFKDKPNAKDVEQLPAYIVLNHKPRMLLVVQSFKTVDAHGTFHRLLPPELAAIVAASMRRVPRSYLFITPREKKPWDTPVLFAKWSNSVLRRILHNPSVSMNTLRHSQLTHVYANKSLTYNQMQRIAHDLGHTVETSLKYRFLVRKPTEVTNAEVNALLA
jgi:hypothetical protein